MQNFLYSRYRITIDQALTFSFLVLFSIFRLFLASGISEPLSSNACASALRKVCEDASAVIFEPANLEILMWIGEVNYFP